MRKVSRHSGLLVFVATALMLGAGCGGDDSGDGVAAGEERTTTTAAASTTTEATSPTTAAGSAANAEDAWTRTATEYRGRDGDRFTIACPPPGQPASIWGVETYTDDSSVCTAAVHVGLITFAEGGEVEIEVGPGEESYDAGVANDVTSGRYGAYEGSFFFPEAPPGSGTFSVSPESWQRTAAEYRGKDGQRVTVRCSPGGPLGSVWGTDTYTDDSSICTAGVHAGLITVAAGGAVVISIAPGASSYRGTSANGVTTQEYGSYEGSFTFPADQPTS